MYKTFFAGRKFNESANRYDPCDNSVVNSADFRFKNDTLNDLFGFKTAVSVDCGNKYRSVVLYIDLCACVCNDLLDELIAQSIKLIGKPAALMNKEEKIRAIQFLNNSGAFLVTKSGDKVSQTFGISKYTLYSYLDAGKTGSL